MPLRPSPLLLVATILAGAALLGADAPLPLAPPPPQNDTVANLIADALQSINLANANRPGSANAAAVPYQAAIQRYNAGDLAGARGDAVQAIIQSAQAALPTAQPYFGPPAIPEPSVPRLPNPPGANEADAGAAAALARETLTDCGPTSGASYAQAAQHYANVVAADVQRNYPLEQSELRAEVDLCAVALAQLAQQSTLATPTPLPTIPLNPTPVPSAIPTPIPAPSISPGALSPAIVPPSPPPPPRTRYLGIFAF